MDESRFNIDSQRMERFEHSLMPDNPSYANPNDDDGQRYDAMGRLNALQQSESLVLCPNCGAPMSEGADFCESCHRYVKYDTCSFCGAALQGDEAYCPECGNPRGGIVCPRCNTMNEFAFCKQCGLPLTDEARQLFLEIRQTPEYKHMQMVADQLSALDQSLPMTSEAEVMHEEANRALRDRVLRLLEEDKGENAPIIQEKASKRITLEEYRIRKQNLAEQLMRVLEEMQTVPTEKPVVARNYAMAMKPSGLRLAWKCNYKNAIHSSPCGCAKPHLGGKWIILGQSSKSKIVDDNG
ncbi:MAG: zinc ribbon domain-containing protein [Prevotella sp.]